LKKFNAPNDEGKKRSCQKERSGDESPMEKKRGKVGWALTPIIFLQEV